MAPKEPFLTRLESRLALGTWIWHALPAGILAMISGWATAVTDALKVYAPASYVFGAMLGVVLYAAIACLFAWRRRHAAIAAEITARSKPLDVVNPLLDTFERQRISIMSLLPPQGRVVESKRFVSCEVVGPAVVNLQGTGTVAEAKLINCDFVTIKKGTPIQNGIGLKNCHMINCTFYQITFLITPDSKIVGDIKGANWLTQPASELTR